MRTHDEDVTLPGLVPAPAPAVEPTEADATTEVVAPATSRRLKLGKPGSKSRSASIKRSSGNVVAGLHLEQSEVIAAVARVDGGLGVQRAAAADLPLGVVRDGEVIDPESLGIVLKRLFAEHRLPKRVRVGIANQRTIMRTIDLPPLEREAEIAAAVRMHAPEHIAMPLDQAILDHQVLGLVDTPEGPRMRVVVVATDRESVLRLIEALRRAGLRPAGVDLAAFALVRALHARAADVHAPVLYAHVAGTTTMAIAEGTACRFTRVSTAGFDAFAGTLAERAEIHTDEARHRLVTVGAVGAADDPLALTVLEAGADQLADDLRTSVEFFASQWGGAVQEIVLTGTALAVPGFLDAIEKRVGLPVRAGEVQGSPDALGGLEPWRVTLATGLSIEEIAS
jgi:type IV pilus assembly protein PilM